MTKTNRFTAEQRAGLERRVRLAERGDHIVDINKKIEPPKYNPVGANTAATTYKPTSAEVEAYHERVRAEQQGRVREAVWGQGCCGR